MARINIEDHLDSDFRFKALIRLLAKAHPSLAHDDISDMAHGRVERFWRLAIKYWGNEELVPFDVFAMEEIDILLACGLAEKRETGIYARGAEEHFDWYLQKCRASRAAKAVRDAAKDRKAHFDHIGNDRPEDRNENPGRPEGPFRTSETQIPEDPLSLSLSLKEIKSNSNPPNPLRGNFEGKETAEVPKVKKPKKPREPKSDRLDKGQAVLYVAEILGAVRKCRDGPAAKAEINPLAWQCLGVEYPSWRAVFESVHNASSRGQLTTAKAQMRDMIAAALPAARNGTLGTPDGPEPI